MINSKTNQACWNCQHFQRYDESVTPTTVAGECRAQCLTEQQGDSLFFTYNWAFISNGIVKWCGRWKKSTKTIPPEPALPIDAEWPASFANWVPWNKKRDENISCWNCNHFQREEETPTDCTGVCTKLNPCDSTHINANTYAGVLGPHKPLSMEGLLYWCGQWERSVETPPTVPEPIPSVRPAAWYQMSGGTVTFYVDSLNGDDLNGDGSPEHPYQSFEFMNRLPEKLTGDVIIKPLAGTWAANQSNWPKRIKIDPSSNGRLIIDASAETWPVLEPDLEIDSVSGLTNQYNGNALATEITVTPDSGWDNDEWYPNFIHVKTGNWAGHVLPIFKNGSDTIVTSPDYLGLVQGDIFDIVETPVTIRVNHEIYVSGTYPVIIGETINDNLESPSSPFFITAGIHLEVENGASGYLDAAINFENLKSFHPFSKFTNANVSRTVLFSRDSECNYQSLPLGTLDYPLFESRDFVATHVACGNTIPGGFIFPALFARGSGLNFLTTRFPIKFLGGQSSYHEKMLLGGLIGLDATVLGDAIYIDQAGFPGDGINTINSYLKINGVYVKDAAIAANISQRCFFRTNWFQGTGITDDYAIHICLWSEFDSTSFANVTITGVVGDAIFDFGAVPVPALPASGSAVVNNCGSVILTE